MKTKLTLALLLTLFLSPLGRTMGEDPNGNRKYHHVLLSKWNQDTTLEDVAGMEALFLRLKEEVDGFEEVTFRSLEACGFDHQALLVFSGKEAMDTYINHPLHDSLRTLAASKVAGFEFYNYWE